MITVVLNRSLLQIERDEVEKTNAERIPLRPISGAATDDPDIECSTSVPSTPFDGEISAGTLLLWELVSVLVCQEIEVQG